MSLLEGVQLGDTIARLYTAGQPISSAPPKQLSMCAPCLDPPPTHLVGEHHFVLIGQQHVTDALAVEDVTRLARVTWLHNNIVKHLEGGAKGVAVGVPHSCENWLAAARLQLVPPPSLCNGAARLPPPLLFTFVT